MSAPTVGQLFPRLLLSSTNIVVPTQGQLYPRAYNVVAAGGPGDGEIGGGGSGGGSTPPAIETAVRDQAGQASPDADSITVTLDVLAGDTLVAHVHTNKALNALAGWAKLKEWSYDFPVGSGFVYYVSAWTRSVDADATLSQVIVVDRASNTWVSSQLEAVIYALHDVEAPLVAATVVPAEKTPAVVSTDPTDSALWLVSWAVSASVPSTDPALTSKYTGERIAGYWGPSQEATEITVDSIANNRVAAVVLDLGLIDGGTSTGTGAGTLDGGTA